MCLNVFIYGFFLLVIGLLIHHNYMHIQIKSKTIAKIKTKSQAKKILFNSEITFLYSKKQLICDEISIIKFIYSHSYMYLQLASLKIKSCKK